ncbi:MAG: ribonuclease HI [Bacteroidales bacterium]|nr:ribonuclease HI [Bacteroidales bacterium]
MADIFIYSDGSSRGNPGPGGYGVVLLSGNHYKELSEGFDLTTNNRMELLGVIKGLEAIKASGGRISVISDSSYVIRAINEGWLKKWKLSGFKKKKNRDLWERFLIVYDKLSASFEINFHWVKGHAGHRENEICDRLAVKAATSPGLSHDCGYENESV